jgi:prepilin-type N-terminal cleavage/methylation domain-containing protein
MEGVLRGRMNHAEKARWQRAGFTLVEVIVVLVILAILAAIAIPALTGYIDKAEDKKYIALARDAAVAIRTVFDEAYSDGTLGSGITPGASVPNVIEDLDYFENGGFNTGAVKLWNSYSLGVTDSNLLDDKDKGHVFYYHKANELIGTGISDAQYIGRDPGTWYFDFCAPNTSGYTLLNAPAFIYRYFPERNAMGRPVVVVTYGIDPLENVTKISEIWTARDDGTMTCNDEAGYKIYHVTRDE